MTVPLFTPGFVSAAGLNTLVNALNAATADTGWLTWATSSLSGWSYTANRARQIGALVVVEFLGTNSSFTGGYTTIGTLPAVIPPPSHTVPEAVGLASSSADSSVRVDTSGNIQLFSNAATTATYGFRYEYLVG